MCFIPCGVDYAARWWRAPAEGRTRKTVGKGGKAPWCVSALAPFWSTCDLLPVKYSFRTRDCQWKLRQNHRPPHFFVTHLWSSISFPYPHENYFVYKYVNLYVNDVLLCFFLLPFLL
jgi:hypothetical protein